MLCVLREDSMRNRDSASRPTSCCVLCVLWVQKVKAELAEWFTDLEYGTPAAASYKLLRVYRIPFAQPVQAPPTDQSKPPMLARRLYICGDHRSAATLDNAIVSGRRAADELLKYM